MQLTIELCRKSFKDIISHDPDGNVNGRVVITCSAGDKIGFTLSDAGSVISSGMLTITEDGISARKGRSASSAPETENETKAAKADSKGTTPEMVEKKKKSKKVAEKTTVKEKNPATKTAASKKTAAKDEPKTKKTAAKSKQQKIKK